MNLNSLRVVVAVALAAGLPSSALADEGDLVEKVAVRNRLFAPAQHWELGLNAGFSILSRLTDHYNLNLSGAYNVADWLAVELRGGYAISRHTSLADQIQSDFMANSSITTANDLADLWEMTANATVGVRFQPIYGKINLMSELPVHFQLYAWAGGGFGLFQRSSVVICTTRANAKDCAETFKEVAPGPIVSVALGFRFFITAHHTLKLEARDFSYLDSYYVDVKRTAGQSDQVSTGKRVQAGITNLVQIDLGYAYIF